RFNYPLILGEGIVVGTITGLVGAGGGFLIIPALVLLAGLPMKQAVGTSLIIIAAKSLIGFTGDLKGHEVIDWNFLLVFSVIAVGGIIAGSILSKRIPNEKLKPAFGWFVLVMGIYIIGRELSNLA
ncbi:MAG TPA: sulfite exporter TauE/SafE family protein, partial [Flavobacteriales bacterium]|nr:sulfite exporter TauE/SafE family protein [Flavobacteriales bacterium]